MHIAYMASMINILFRSGTYASESSSEARIYPHIRKRITRQRSTVSNAEKHHYESSSESIGPVGGTKTCRIN